MPFSYFEFEKPTSFLVPLLELFPEQNVIQYSTMLSMVFPVGGCGRGRDEKQQNGSSDIM